MFGAKILLKNKIKLNDVDNNKNKFWCFETAVNKISRLEHRHQYEIPGEKNILMIENRYLSDMQTYLLLSSLREY